ncbi:hypothetical protein [Sphingomonas aerophila]|uniref:Lipoprotein n=1 Tax=Sphingomonas aerophila TaxID=1344948 RepID=A0A7W9ETQ0_9SPHN|nr:hypothetical protein [Sphingomonas aerophila]MBB5714439.1 hypothetical protein [Sphingomonas aerophila]
MRRLYVSLLFLPLVTTACGKGDGGTSISVKDEGGRAVASADGNSGQVKLDVPGFEGKITLPKIKLDASNFDLNGVHLYPGSQINGFNLRAGENNKGGVRVTFTSPAEPATVRDWLAERLNKAEFKLRSDGTGLVGKTDENQDFRLQLRPTGDHQSLGELVIG